MSRILCIAQLSQIAGELGRQEFFARDRPVIAPSQTAASARKLFPNRPLSGSNCLQNSGCEEKVD
jgi:hypothetical protein